MVTKDKTLQKDAMNMLKQTSRTFYIPITLLKPTLKHTVGSAYLCMRAVDEIEDNEQLDRDIKKQLLNTTSELLLEPTFDEAAYRELLEPYKTIIPEVSQRLGDWLEFCPDGIVAKVKTSTSEMAAGMAKWVQQEWDIQTKEDLDDYTYYVAGLVGVMLSDIWEWYDGTRTDRNLAIGYGRGLQAVNILRNQDEDYAERGVRFIPEGWGRKEVFAYAEDNLELADIYMKDITTRNIILFCKIPLALAKKTLQTMKSGREKMTREEVTSTVDAIVDEKQKDDE